MPIGRKRGWELPESAATPEQVYLKRRRIVGDGELDVAREL